MLFYEPGKISLESFPLVNKIRKEDSTAEVVKEADIPIVPEEFYNVQVANDELAKNIQEINGVIAEDLVSLTTDEVIHEAIEEIMKVLGGNTSAFYLCSDGQSKLTLYDEGETEAVLDLSNSLTQKLCYGEAVCCSGDVLSSGIIADGIVPVELSSSVSFLALPLEMMGMLLGILFLGFEIEISADFDQVKEALVPYMTKLTEALG